MALSGNFFEIRDQSEQFSSELDCGWNGYPGNGGIIVKFYDKDEDGFEWLLELDFQPESAGTINMGGTAILNDAKLTLTNNGTEIEHDIKTYVSSLPTFSHVAAVVLQARKLKPYVSPAEKEAKAAKKAEEAIKKQMENMGIKIGQ
jgi:hypothetical protein